MRQVCNIGEMNSDHIVVKFCTFEVTNPCVSYAIYEYGKQSRGNN